MPKPIGSKSYSTVSADDFNKWIRDLANSKYDWAFDKLDLSDAFVHMMDTTLNIKGQGTAHLKPQKEEKRTIIMGDNILAVAGNIVGDAYYITLENASKIDWYDKLLVTPKYRLKRKRDYNYATGKYVTSITQEFYNLNIIKIDYDEPILNVLDTFLIRKPEEEYEDVVFYEYRYPIGIKITKSADRVLGVLSSAVQRKYFKPEQLFQELVYVLKVKYQQEKIKPDVFEQVTTRMDRGIKLLNMATHQGGNPNEQAIALRSFNNFTENLIGDICQLIL